MRLAVEAQLSPALAVYQTQPAATAGMSEPVSEQGRTEQPAGRDGEDLPPGFTRDARGMLHDPKGQYAKTPTPEERNEAQGTAAAAAPVHASEQAASAGPAAPQPTVQFLAERTMALEAQVREMSVQLAESKRLNEIQRGKLEKAERAKSKDREKDRGRRSVRSSVTSAQVRAEKDAEQLLRSEPGPKFGQRQRELEEEAEKERAEAKALRAMLAASESQLEAREVAMREMAAASARELAEAQGGAAQAEQSQARSVGARRAAERSRASSPARRR